MPPGESLNVLGLGWSEGPRVLSISVIMPGRHSWYGSLAIKRRAGPARWQRDLSIRGGRMTLIKATSPRLPLSPTTPLLQPKSSIHYSFAVAFVFVLVSVAFVMNSSLQGRFRRGKFSRPNLRPGSREVKSPRFQKEEPVMMRRPIFSFIPTRGNRLYIALRHVS